MKILYAIQGTGNGHLSRACDVVPALMKRVDVDVMVSGVQGDLDLPFPVKYRYKGLSFIFGKNGGINLLKTFKQIKIRQILKEINACPVQNYDLVINDFEPISAWSSRLKKVPCISLSHQAAFCSKNAPKPKQKDFIGALILKNYARCKEYYGFHFEKYDDHIYSPIIRNEIRNQEISNSGHYTVYLPSYSDAKLIEVLSSIKEVEWQVFSKHAKDSYQIANISVTPVNSSLFISSMAASKGVLCGAGFETPAEALFLKKKLLVVPMRLQYEQHLNAESLNRLGVPVLKKVSFKELPKIKLWLQEEHTIAVNFFDETQLIIDKVLELNHSLMGRLSLKSRVVLPEIFDNRTSEMLDTL
jgi:uncharacterized protein (TIGR00661 family)